MAHQLNLSIEDDLLDLRFLSVTDLSVYDDRIAVTNLSMIVRVPGADVYNSVNFVKSEKTTYTSRSLKYTTGQAPCELPDGLYEFTYSVCPNEQVYINKKHFRVSNLEWSIKSEMARTSINLYEEFDIDDCGNIKLSKEQNRLITLLYQLEAIRGAFYNDNYQKAVDIYNYVKKQLDKYLQSQHKICN